MISHTAIGTTCDLTNGHGDQTADDVNAILGQRAAGNISRVVKEQPNAIPVAQVRDGYAFAASDRINSLNQVKRNDVNSAMYDYAHADVDAYSGTVRYSYDASGNLLSKTDGSLVTTYVWDEDNRLTQVSLPSGVTVSYTYDVLGRLLTKTHSVNGTTRYEWDGFDCVREYAPSTTGTAVYDSAHCDGTDKYGWSGVTQYYVVNGVLWGIDFDGGATNAVIADALGHVRLLVDPNGNTPFSANYDAWGNTLFVTDNVPNGGWNYRYVGAFGVRADLDTGLVYMRQRWYDPQLGRFISRDLMRDGNLYAYASNKPTTYTDPTGMDAGATAIAIAGGLAIGGLFYKTREWWSAYFNVPSEADIEKAVGRYKVGDRDLARRILKYYQQIYPQVTQNPCDFAAQKTASKILDAFSRETRVSISTATSPTWGGAQVENYATITIGGVTTYLYAGAGFWPTQPIQGSPLPASGNPAFPDVGHPVPAPGPPVPPLRR